MSENYKEVGEIWFRRHGCTLANGRKQIMGDADVHEFLDAPKSDGWYHLYLVHPEKEKDRVNPNVYRKHVTWQKLHTISATKKRPKERVGPHDQTITSPAHSKEPSGGFEEDGEDDLIDSDDDLDSIVGSDDEGVYYPVFTPQVNFKGKIVLSKGLKFPSNIISRKAIRHHVVENGYNYYFLHNNRSKVTVFCAKRCSCPWKKGRFLMCKCGDKKKCRFKIHSRKLKDEETWQIKKYRPDHICGHQYYNPKVTSQYLAAERYLEDWKDDPNWKLKHFIKRMVNRGYDEVFNMRINQADLYEFEVDHEGDTFVVNLEKHECGCYRWTLMAYHVETYAKAYAPSFKAMPGQNQWDVTPYPAPLPPHCKKMVGRPSNKKRVKEPEEDVEKNVNRAKKQNRCSGCGDHRHYVNKCSKPNDEAGSTTYA
uniref:Transposase MuDR plant domain-containing protein n=1 Tax=Chenopodium quinoa TaxID=63459 RepID=A0A803LVZ2_CHEQI